MRTATGDLPTGRGLPERITGGAAQRVQLAIARDMLARYARMMLECDQIRAVFGERRDGWERLLKEWGES